MGLDLITDIDCVIIAGGKNSRYGGFHKSFLRIEDEFLIDKNIKLLSQIFGNIFVIANKPDIYHGYNFKIHEDIHKDIGPMGGIHSALSHTQKDAIFAFSCDMPYLSQETIIKIYEEYKKSKAMICVPRNLGRFEPLHAIYSKQLVDVIEDQIIKARDFSLQAIIKNNYTAIVEINNPRHFININSPEDLERL